VKISKIAVLIVALGLLAFATSSIADRPEPKITICHIPPGNPANAHSITIDAGAVPEHQALHGDTLGPCEGPVDGPPPCTGGDCPSSR